VCVAVFAAGGGVGGGEELLSGGAAKTAWHGCIGLLLSELLLCVCVLMGVGGDAPLV
jgi:hypothetical protein